MPFHLNERSVASSSLSEKYEGQVGEINNTNILVRQQEKKHGHHVIVAVLEKMRNSMNWCFYIAKCEGRPIINY